ncbi:hypothetical protein PoB_003200900 [Plakobranchus ocellatus]|uniref:Uncharacterized protein n=1 Tax=Plakobranchus ocellatus TaxID=259542 RepID=A0AAV4AGX7_9GAST|nr:hypothetical protein PoB_003200900 [Plakobranchus ocellatus]
MTHEQKELPRLSTHTRVAVQDTMTGIWSPATVIKQCSEPRSYIVRMESVRRNRRHLKEIVPTNTTYPHSNVSQSQKMADYYQPHGQ